jgi:thiamine pyrophosphate-dependent acetolactate synthase large subunit-like protein
VKAVLVSSSDEIKRAASVLNEGGKTTILCGQGALGYGELVEEIAEKLAAPVTKALLRKPLFRMLRRLRPAGLVCWVHYRLSWQ